LQCLADNALISDLSKSASSSISRSFREPDEVPAPAANEQQNEREAVAGPAPKAVGVKKKGPG